MSTWDLEKFLVALQDVLPKNRSAYVLHEPQFIGNELAYVKECIETGWVSTVGTFVDKFEMMLKDYTGTEYTIAVVNGTAALHICLKLIDVEADDEVLLPALSFVATANAVKYCDAIPHFIDCDEETLGVDPIKLGNYLDNIALVRDNQCINKTTNRRVKALIAMHTFGHPVDLDPLVEICAKFRIELIEDAAESLGSFYKGKHTGNFGKLSALSFNGNKIISTGGGGAILTNNKTLAQRAKHLTTTAKLQHPWEYFHDQVGYNYRMPNLNAALGCAQLEQLPKFLETKRALANLYRHTFTDFPGITIFSENDFAKSNYWLNTLILEESYAQNRDVLLTKTNEIGIKTRPIWKSLHKLPMFINCPRMDLVTSESLERRIINLPSSPSLLN